MLFFPSNNKVIGNSDKLLTLFKHWASWSLLALTCGLSLSELLTSYSWSESLFLNCRWPVALVSPPRRHQNLMRVGIPRNPLCLNTHTAPEESHQDLAKCHLLFFIVLERSFLVHPKLGIWFFSDWWLSWMHPRLFPLLLPSAEPPGLQHEFCA